MVAPRSLFYIFVRNINDSHYYYYYSNALRATGSRMNTRKFLLIVLPVYLSLKVVLKDRVDGVRADVPPEPTLHDGACVVHVTLLGEHYTLGTITYLHKQIALLTYTRHHYLALLTYTRHHYLPTNR